MTGTRMLTRRLASCRPVMLMVMIVALCVLGREAATMASAVPALRQSTVIENPAARFSISLVPAVPVPIRIGTSLGFNLSSSTAGYYSLYLIDPVGEVWVLAENLPLGATTLTYPSPPQQNFTLAAAEPLGTNRVILLVTREPLAGFSGDATLTRAVSLAIRGAAFVSRLNAVLATLPRSDWATDEISVRVVA